MNGIDMNVIVAKSAGFCMGVRRAVNNVLNLTTVEENKKICVLGPLIHNKQVNDMLRKKHVMIANSIDDISGEICVIRTHGISPQKKDELIKRNVEIFDATCPRVLKVQNVIKKHAEKGYFIIIVGDKGHAEVEGLLGFTNENGMVVDAVDRINEIPSHVQKICVVAQTTQNYETFKKIELLLKEKYSDCVVFDTICGSTSERQQEVIEMAGIVDAIAIVGGSESANTMRLVEISRSTGVPTYHVETHNDINKKDFSVFQKIGVSAGASTPNITVHQVAECLRSIEK